MSETDMGKRIGRRVADRRRDRGWDQSELARRAGVRPSYISRLESGQYGRPSAEQLSKLARALLCDLSDLTETEAAPAPTGIRVVLEAMGLDPVEESQLMAEFNADVATMPPGRDRLDTIRALRTLVRPKTPPRG